MIELLRKIWQDDEGQDIAEYAVMLAVVHRNCPYVGGDSRRDGVTQGGSNITRDLRSSHRSKNSYNFRTTRGEAQRSDS